MTERELYVDPYRAERVSVEPLPPHDRLDLIVEEDGLAASARLDPAGARAVRDALDEWLREVDPPTLPSPRDLVDQEP